jgi:hypothetical protein
VVSNNYFYCDILAKVRERLAVSKQTTQKFDMERFNLTKLNEVEEYYLLGYNKLHFYLASPAWPAY